LLAKCGGPLAGDGGACALHGLDHRIPIAKAAGFGKAGTRAASGTDPSGASKRAATNTRDSRSNAPGTSPATNPAAYRSPTPRPYPGAPRHVRAIAARGR
jgi:hypothetical protein